MERQVLIDEIVSFCMTYGDKDIKINELRNVIANQIEDATFLENLINTIIINAKNRKKVDIDKLIELLVELERIRLEQEFKNYSLVS